MNDPIRWLDEGGGATEHERALLDAVREVGPKPRDREAVWAAVAGATGVAVSTKSTTLGTVLKVMVGALVIGASVWFLFGRSRPTAPVAPRLEPITAPSVSSPAPVMSSAPPTPSVVVPPAVEHVEPKTVKTPSPPLASSPSGAPVSRLKEESELTFRARDALRANEFDKARTLIDAAKVKFPTGVLVQERKALEIELLYRTGKRTEADALAAAFLETYPNSPHAARIRELAKQ